MITYHILIKGKGQGQVIKGHYMAGGIHSIASPFAVAMERKLNRSRFWRDPANRTLSSDVSYIAKGVFATQLYVTSRSIGRPIVAIFYSFLKRKHEGFDVYFLI